MNVCKQSLTRLIGLLLVASIAHPGFAQESQRVRFAVTNPPHFLPI